MDEFLLYATARQLAKLQYWATRALDFDHETSVQRAQMAVREYAGDLEQTQAGLGWWERIAVELEQLNSKVDPAEKPN